MNRSTNGPFWKAYADAAFNDKGGNRTFTASANSDRRNTKKDLLRSNTPNLVAAVPKGRESDGMDGTFSHQRLNGSYCRCHKLQMREATLCKLQQSASIWLRTSFKRTVSNKAVQSCSIAHSDMPRCCRFSSKLIPARGVGQSWDCPTYFRYISWDCLYGGYIVTFGTIFMPVCSANIAALVNSFVAM
jgi:hypothetical protein